MLTESEARDLLAKAANTVEVVPGPPIERASRTIWPMLAAAAAVVAVVGTTAAVVDRTNDRAGSPTVDPTTASPRPVLAPDQIPSVFAYDGASATRLLETRGLEVTTKPDYTCGTTGRATKTDPAVGARFQPGDAVTLYVTQIPPNARCVRPAVEDAAWQFLDFANDRGPAPAFADEVTLYVNGVAQTLTGAEAADPGSWGNDSALEGLSAASSEVIQAGSSYATPYLRVGRRPIGSDIASYYCGELPAVLESRPALWLGIKFPHDGIDICPFDVGILETGGRIDSIVSRTEPQAVAEVSDPDGLGARFLEFARGSVDALPVAPTVELYLGNKHLKTISSTDANRTGAWDLCAPYAEASCPLSAVRMLQQYDGRPAYTTDLPGNCLDTLADKQVTAGDSGGTSVVVLSPPEPRSCMDAFAIQVFYNDIPQVTGVNLLSGSP